MWKTLTALQVLGQKMPVKFECENWRGKLFYYWSKSISIEADHESWQQESTSLCKGGGPILLTTSSFDVDQYIDPLHHRPLQQNNCPHLTGIKPYVKAIIVEVATTF